MSLSVIDGEEAQSVTQEETRFQYEQMVKIHMADVRGLRRS